MSSRTGTKLAIGSHKSEINFQASPLISFIAGISLAIKRIVFDRGREQKCEVLIIEDEWSVADALKMILEHNGYRVTIAVTGQSGIQEALRGRFCLTITDVGLSDMSGFDVIKTICRYKSQMHFIIITSNYSEKLMVRARRCGAAGVLIKPFLPSEILQLIQTTLAE